MLVGQVENQRSIVERTVVPVSDDLIAVASATGSP
jgi:hypothetical protein